MTDTLQEANAKLREAVESRLAAGGAASAACCEGGRCHPAAIDTRGPVPDVDQVVSDDDEQTPESPFLSGHSNQGQIEEAWAAVKRRYEETQRKIRGESGRRVFLSEQPPVVQSCNEAERVLRDAIDTVRDRREKYGPPAEHFRRTVGAINAIFAHKLREPLTPEDWAQIMILDKLARHQEKPQRDNPLDGCGYAACWAETMLEARQ